MIIVHLTDLHLRPVGLAAYRCAETNMLTERALRAVRGLTYKPDAIIISGDLTNNGLACEYAVFSEMLARLITAPVYVIPGNHDERRMFKQSLAHFPGVAEHPTFVQYAIDDHDIRLIMLDSVIPGEGAGELCAERLAWLDATLSAQPHRPSIVVLHHPPFSCGSLVMDRIMLRDSAAFASVIARHRQVQRILCGHHHRSMNAMVAHCVACVAPSVAHQTEFVLDEDPAFWNLEPPAYQILVTTPDHGIVAHTVYVENFPGPFPFVPDPT